MTAIETRISMLSMTFIKYVDLNVCCFIPGKVMDFCLMENLLSCLMYKYLIYRVSQTYCDLPVNDRFLIWTLQNQ